MMTISLIFSTISGWMRMAAAMLVSGPTGIRVMSPSEAIRVSTSQLTAFCRWGWMVAAGR